MTVNHIWGCKGQSKVCGSTVVLYVYIFAGHILTERRYIFGLSSYAGTLDTCNSSPVPKGGGYSATIAYGRDSGVSDAGLLPGESRVTGLVVQAVQVRSARLAFRCP